MSNKEKKSLNLRRQIKKVGKELLAIEKKENKLIIEMDNLQKKLAKVILEHD